MTEFKLIVAGGRDYANYEHMSRVLFAMADTEFADKDISIVASNREGASPLSIKLAKDNRIPIRMFGLFTDMCRNADAMVILWDHKTYTEWYMSRLMNRLGKPVHVIKSV